MGQAEPMGWYSVEETWTEGSRCRYSSTEEGGRGCLSFVDFLFRFPGAYCN